MKTPTTAEEWATYHCDCFAIVGDADTNGVIAWAKTFTRAGVSVADLVAATDWMVLNVAPQWRREHLTYIQQSLQRFRILRLNERNRIEVPTAKGCEGCNNTGFIFVPHPKDIRDGQWGGKYECVVACPCHAGDRNVAGFLNYRQERPKQGFAGQIEGLRTLVNYENEYPDWREMAFQKRDHRREMDLRESEARFADKKSGPLRKRLIYGIGKPIDLPTEEPS